MRDDRPQRLTVAGSIRRFCGVECNERRLTGAGVWRAGPCRFDLLRCEVISSRGEERLYQRRWVQISILWAPLAVAWCRDFECPAMALMPLLSPAGWTHRGGVSCTSPLRRASAQVRKPVFQAPQQIVKYLCLLGCLKKLLIDWLLGESKKERERERNINFLFHIFIHLLVALTRVRTHNLDASGWLSNQLSYPARVPHGSFWLFLSNPIESLSWTGKKTANPIFCFLFSLSRT